MPTAVRHDDPRLYRDVGGRTALNAVTGSRLARFLEDLADVWTAPKILSITVRLPRTHFTDTDLTARIEADLTGDCWAALAKNSMMPIAAPHVAWVAVPEIVGSGVSAVSEEVVDAEPAEPMEFPAEPGTALPTGAVACCRVTVMMVPLPRPIAP